MPYQTSQTVKPHHAVCKKTSPNGEPMIGLSTLLSFPVSTSKTKRATAPVNAKIVQYYGPQKIRHKMLQLSRIAKFSNELCTTVIGHKRTRLNLAHLVGSPSPRLWIWPAILHHISRLSKSPQNFSLCLTSHRARRSTNFNVALWVWKSWSEKKENHWESHKNDWNIMPSWLDSAPRLETFHIKARWSRKEKKNVKQKGNLKKQKEQGAGKESEGRRNNKLKNNEINGIQNRI